VVENLQQHTTATAMTGGVKQANFKIRDEMRKLGAVFVTFQPLLQHDLPANRYAHVVAAWKVVEQKGLQITDFGCWIPWKHYCKGSGKGAKAKGKKQSSRVLLWKVSKDFTSNE
jgi:hypothetical protein